jgi:FkbM family methyltransferase
VLVVFFAATNKALTRISVFKPQPLLRILALVSLLPPVFSCTRSMNYQYNQETVQVMKRAIKPGNAAIDVGAFIGEILEPMVDIGPGVRHYAFEPQPNRFIELKKRFPTVNVYNLALGDTAGALPFVLALDAPARSGFLRREYPVGEDRTKDTMIQVVRMDDIIPDSVKIDFIKIDVEGAEFMVLRGGKETVLRNKPVIVFEYGKGSSENYGTTPEYVWELFTETFSMRLWLMADWLENKPAFDRETFLDQYNNRMNYMFLAAP